jgi:hypothetical protein
MLYYNIKEPSNRRELTATIYHKQHRTLLTTSPVRVAVSNSTHYRPHILVCDAIILTFGTSHHDPCCARALTHVIWICMRGLQPHSIGSPPQIYAWADYLKYATVVWFISKSVSMTILRYTFMSLINLSTQYLSASNVIFVFMVRTVYWMGELYITWNGFCVLWIFLGLVYTILPKREELFH